MKALVVERPEQAEVRQVPRPEPGPGEVLARVGAAGICGSDLELLHGRRPAPFVRYPITPGHEWAGTVAATGDRVTEIQPGDLVVAEGFRSCGTCARCREGRTNLCAADYAETGFTHPGAFAEYVSVPAALVHRLPPGSSLAAAALLEPAACVANGLLAADLRPGLAVVVVGGGTLGLLAVSLVRLTSPSRLALVDLRADRLQLGRELGASETADPSDADPAATLGGDFDLVFEAAGREGSAAGALSLARRGGTVLLEGIVGGDGSSLDPDEIVLQALTVHGIFGASRAAWSWVVDLFARGLLDTQRLITHRYPLESYGQAFDALQNPGAGAIKVQLVPDGAAGQEG